MRGQRKEKLEAEPEGDRLDRMLLYAVGLTIGIGLMGLLLVALAVL